MQAISVRIFLVLFALAFLNPSLSLSAAEQRTALVIGNSTYSTGPLRNPVNDASDMATALKRVGFSVVLKKNANLQTMEEAIEDFGNRLKRGGVGLFYYAGHGVQVGGINYLIPIEAKINKESDVRFKAFDAGRILAEMENANNGLNIVLLDACRDNPFGRSFRGAARGLAIVSNAPTGTFISYSTSPGQVARDGEGRNSPYTRALLQYMKEPGIPMGEVFMKVRQKLRKETGQVPWELSSLEGNFYFVPRSAGKQATAREELTIAATVSADAADNGSRDRSGPQIAPVKPLATPTVTETRRDGRFIAYSDGTVLDTKTNLMWAARDNGSGINWTNAKRYCENYRGGGYADWRMPTHSELAGLYDSYKSQKNEATPQYPVHITELIDLTSSYTWASETRGSDAAYFQFYDGRQNGNWTSKSYDFRTRALPVRSTHKVEQRRPPEDRKGTNDTAKATTRPPAASGVTEIARNARFIAYSDGTVLDTRTNLMWSAKDNGTYIQWADAKTYCEKFRGGGYLDWRLPTHDELAGLYDGSKSYKVTHGNYDVHMTDFIKISSCCPWASETRGSDVAYFNFRGTGKGWVLHYDRNGRALPVRSIK